MNNKAILLLWSLLTLAGAAQSQDLALDIAIVGGRLIDPETATDQVMNLGIRDNRIVLLTDQAIVGARTINASGKVVSPGFIDMHAHGQNILSARVQAHDGVTTALELESGVWPVSDWYTTVADEGRPINYGASVNWANARIDALLGPMPADDDGWMERKFDDPAWQQDVATPEQLAGIAQRVADGLDEGGLGVGFLLGYAPGAGRKEYFEITALAAERKMPTYTHARYLSMLEPGSSFEGIAEIVAAAAGSGVHAHIVHLNSISLRDIDAIGKMIAGAQSQGIKVSTEAYPYGAGATSIGAAMFRAENWQARIGGIGPGNFDLNGKRLTASEFRLLQLESPGTGVVVHLLDTEVAADRAILDQSVLFQNGVIASDGGGWSLNKEPLPQTTWPLPEAAWSHPRSAGTYARFLRQYVRETGQVSLLEAVRRVSYGPARLLEESVPQMRRKGRLQEGADADIVIFDLDRVADHATYTVPAQVSSGFEFVIVNGEILIDEGVLDTDRLPGKPIRND